jgi:hypothetical protein
MPKLSDEEKTMFAVKLNRSHTEVVWLILLLAGLFSVFAVIGGFQYYNCYKDDPDVTVRQCFSLTKLGKFR